MLFIKVTKNIIFLFLEFVLLSKVAKTEFKGTLKILTLPEQDNSQTFFLN